MASDQTLSCRNLLSHCLNKSSTFETQIERTLNVSRRQINSKATAFGYKRILHLAAPSKCVRNFNYFLLSLTEPFPIGQASLPIIITHTTAHDDCILWREKREEETRNPLLFTCCSGALMCVTIPGMFTLFLCRYFRKTSAFLRANVQA